jgi:hypothetical protein
MTSDLNFLGDASAPTGPAVPSAKEIQAMGVIGLDLGRSGRVSLMNQIGAFLHMPSGGWHGQAKLFKGNDIRLADLLQAMTREHTAKLMASNLQRAARFVQVNLMLAMVSAQREGHRSLTATGSTMINTYREGGLDFLEKLKSQLGLPHAVTATWKAAPAFVNIETNNTVYPELIPARDQMLAYSAVVAASFNHNFKASLRAEFGDQAAAASSAASRAAIIVWQAYSFLSPGGRPYDPKKALRDQLSQHFGHRSALGLLAHKARENHRRLSLDDILTDTSLNGLEWLRSAKTRAAETLFCECLLRRARQLMH